MNSCELIQLPSVFEFVIKFKLFIHFCKKCRLGRVIAACVLTSYCGLRF
jgi:hypothetical protein